MEIAVFLLIFLSISSLATIGICFVEFRQDNMIDNTMFFGAIVGTSLVLQIQTRGFASSCVNKIACSVLKVLIVVGRALF